MAETIREMLVRENALDKQIKLDVSSILWKYEPEVTPFLTISSKMSSEQAINTKVEWLNKNPLPIEVTYTGADESSASTTITVANWSYLRARDQLFNTRTKEIILISATDPAAASITGCTRDWGSATAGAGLLKTGDRLLIKSSGADESMDLSASPRAILPTEDYNYTEHWEDFCQTSKIAEMVETVTGQDLRQQSIDDIKSFHRKKIELSVLFGERAQTQGTTYYIRNMRGLLNAISTNEWPLADISDFTRLAFDDFIMQINENTPDRKSRVFICSGLLKSRIGGWAMNMLQINNQKTKELGMEIFTYRGSTGGSFDIVEHPLLVGDYLSYMGFFLEYERMAWKWLQKTLLELNTQEAYKNYRLDKISTIGTMRLTNENRMGLIKKAA